MLLSMSFQQQTHLLSDWWVVQLVSQDVPTAFGQKRLGLVLDIPT